MHWECFTFFECCHLTSLTSNTAPSVLDIGSYDINGSLKYLFPDSDYTGLDLANGPNVDVVVSGADYNTDKRYDITLSCECFEHNPQYLLTFQNMINLTKANGLVVFTCATTGRPVHGTKDTSPHSSLASQQVSSNYYKNLVEEDFSSLDLDNIFSSYSFYENEFSKDLYFIGRKRSCASQDTLPTVGNIEAVKLILEVSEKFHTIENSFHVSSSDVIRELVNEVYTNYYMSNLALTRLMKSLIRIGDYDEALSYGEFALKHQFNQVANLTLQSRCHLKKGNLEPAYKLIKQASNLPQILSPQNATMMADIENKLFGNKLALLTIKKSLHVFPNEKETLWRLHLWAEQSGNRKESVDAMAKMKELFPTDERCNKNIVVVKHERRKLRVLIDDKERHLRAYEFGRVALSLILAYLEIQDVDLSVAVGDCKKVRAELGDKSPLTTVNYVNYWDVKDDDFDYALAVCPPGKFNSLLDNTYIYTMVDVSDVPMKWLDVVKTAKGVVVPSRINQEIFSKHFSFVQTVPLNAPLKPFTIRKDWRSEGKEKFSFIFVGTHSYRQGFDVLISAFLKEFEASEAKLTVICTESPSDRICNAVIQSMNEAQSLGDIEVITKPITDAWLSRLYSRHDCFVLFTRGEGWGISAMEAAVCGLPVICPDKIASWDFLHPDFNISVPSHLEEVDRIQDPFAAGWAKSYGNDNLSYINITEDDARKSMRQAFEQRNEIKMIGEASSKHVLETFTFKKMCADIKLLNENIKKILETKL